VKAGKCHSQVLRVLIDSAELRLVHGKLTLELADQII